MDYVVLEILDKCVKPYFLPRQNLHVEKKHICGTVDLCFPWVLGDNIIASDTY